MTAKSNRPLHIGMRWVLRVAAVLVFIAGVQLYVFSEQTDIRFAWTIKSSLTAAFLGAGYWASGIMALIASWQVTWKRARVAIVNAFIFTLLTTLATFTHFDKFHLGEQELFITKLATWAWLAVYTLVPIIFVVLWVIQERQPGGEKPSHLPLSSWIRAVLGLHAIILLPLGVLLFLSPIEVSPVWPWGLTALTARAVAAWLVGIGAAAALVAYENDWERAYVAAPTYIVLGGLQLIAVWRYGSEINFASPSAWVYMAVIISMLVTGGLAWWEARQLESTEKL